MREIKFRAWDKIWKQFRKLAYLNYDGTTPTGQWEVDGELFVIGEEIILLQYTGLKDKNGKEIYEGDIVKVTDPYTEVREWTDVVKWQHDGYYLDVVINADYPKVEVIGNIYENPELLKEGDKNGNS